MIQKNEKRKLSNLLWVISIFLITLGFLCSKVNAQSTKPVIADETSISYTQKQIKVQTSNDYIYREVRDEYEDICTRINTSFKTDRHGRYKVWTFYMPRDKEKEVVAFIRKLRRTIR